MLQGQDHCWGQWPLPSLETPWRCTENEGAKKEAPMDFLSVSASACKWQFRSSVFGIFTVSPEELLFLCGPGIVVLIRVSWWVLRCKNWQSKWKDYSLLPCVGFSTSATLRATFWLLSIWNGTFAGLHFSRSEPVVHFSLRNQQNHSCSTPVWSMFLPHRARLLAAGLWVCVHKKKKSLKHVKKITCRFC